jgi:hypothetical protein
MNLHSEYIINKKWQFGRIKIYFTWRSNKGFWGRFGGGWNWAFGFRSCATSILIQLIFCELNISWYKPPSKTNKK